jgi:DMSO/TMAO reductase YedYZ molybdopterin-dependent catalytic subunit
VGTKAVTALRRASASAARAVDAARWDGIHEPRTAAILGIALGVAFTTCFATGLLSHLAQHEPPWFDLPTRPAGLYRVTQGAHVVTGMASIPLLLAKLWVVYPRFVAWPPVRSVAHAVERAMLLPLVGGSLFLLFSGTANVARWYPWGFFFPAGHFWAAWVTVGALVVHVGAKATSSLAALRATPPVGLVRASPADRRAFLAGAGAAAGAIVMATAGGTVGPLSDIAGLAQRRPDDGPQGIPVNKAASQAGVADAALDPGWRLVVEGTVRRRLVLSLDELKALPQREAVLPIACVEGWSASARWRGVPVRDLLDMAGASEGAEATVESLQNGGRYAVSELNRWQARDRDTLLAVELDGAPLHIDHGYPVRLIGPNRPGVLQTKWVRRLVVR